MAEILTLPADLKDLLRAVADEAGTGLYLVGGFVRDLLLGLANTDIDIVVEGDAISFAEKLAARYGGASEPHPQFRTATWHFDPQHFHAPADFIDFATARTETYEAPGALPTVTTPVSIDLDLFRRDFTINAMAIRLAPAPVGLLVDPYAGRTDLADGLIRVLHDQSFIDDGTRMFRAVRFEQRLGFEIEAHTLSLIGPALPYLKIISGERIRHEFDLIFDEAQPEKMLQRLADLHILQEVTPTLIVDEWTSTAFAESRRQFAQSHWQAEMPHIYWSILACRLHNVLPLD
jgi:tRNA nucleotidyltransferase (CCA-adding enzyme)